MKAVVVEIRGSRAVLMTERGAFEKVRNKNYRVGQEVSRAEKRSHPVRRWLLAACILLAFMTGTGTLAARLPFAYVSLDINPSLEYSLNWFDRVISVRAINDDAQPIVQELLEEGVIDQPADRAIGMTLSKLQQNRYVVSGSESDVLLAVASYGIKNVDGLTKRLAASADEYGRRTSITITTIQADSASIKRSEDLNTTAGKLMLVESLGALEGNSSDFSKEEWLNKPVRDILDRKKAIQQKPSADGLEVRAPSPTPSAAPDAEPTSEGKGKGSPTGKKTPSASIAPEKSLSPKPQTAKPKSTKSPSSASPGKKTPVPSDQKNDNTSSGRDSSQDHSQKQGSSPKHSKDAQGNSKH